MKKNSKRREHSIVLSTVDKSWKVTEFTISLQDMKVISEVIYCPIVGIVRLPLKSVGVNGMSLLLPSPLRFTRLFSFRFLAQIKKEGGVCRVGT